MRGAWRREPDAQTAPASALACAGRAVLLTRMPRDRRNALVFFTDQQRWDCSGLHGNPLDLMPTFDRVARAGTHCALACTNQPVCGPARSIMQTGRYATATGCHRNAIPLPTGADTIAKRFDAAGWRTGYIGKWHLAPDDLPGGEPGSGAGPVAREHRGGYRDWLAANTLERTSDAYDTRLWDEELREVRLPGYRVDALADAAIRWIDARRDEPFLLFLSFLEPHHQNHRDDYPAPIGSEERYAGRWLPPDLAALPRVAGTPHESLAGGTAHQHYPGYCGMVRRLDDAFARVLDALVSLGLLDDTVVLFTSDHGCHFKTRNHEYKRSCHDASIRVPMAWHGGPFTGGGRIDAPVGLVDVVPTLCDACGVAPPEGVHGRSLLPLLRDRGAPWPDDVFVQISESQTGRCVRTRRWCYAVEAPEGDRADGRAERYVETRLYDLKADPWQLTNLVEHDSHAEVRAVLRGRLLRRMREAGEDEPAIDPPARTVGRNLRVDPAEARE